MNLSLLTAAVFSQLRDSLLIACHTVQMAGIKTLTGVNCWLHMLNGCVQFYTINDIIPLIMGKRECTPTLFLAYIKEAGWLVYPDTVFYPPCLHYTGRKECRGTLFPAHYEGNDVIISVKLYTSGMQVSLFASVSISPVETLCILGRNIKSLLVLVRKELTNCFAILTLHWPL